VKEGLGRRQEKKGQGWIGMKRKIWSVILTVCMVLGMMPAMSVHVAASAMIYYTVGETKIGNDAGPIASATGDGWTWTYSDGAGTLTLTDAYIRGADSDGDSYGACLPANTTIVLNGDSTIAGGAASRDSIGVYCRGALTIKDGDAGSLSAVGGKSSEGKSMGLEVYDSLTSLTINSGRVTGLGGTADDSSYGINAPTLIVSGSADVTGIAGTANHKDSCGVFCNHSVSVEGSLTAVGAYANDGQSYGIKTFFSLNVSGGTVVAQGGKGTSNYSSYGVYVINYSPTTLTGGLLVASSDFQALNIAPTDGNKALTPLTGLYDSSLAVYGNSETYTSNNIYNSTLNLSNSELAKSTWSNSDANSGWMWDADSSTLNLKNMIIVGTDETGSDTGSFGIQGGKDISIVYEGVNVVCGGTSESGDSCGIMDEVSDEDGLSLSGVGTLVALGRQAGDSSCGVQLSNPEKYDTGSLKVSSGKVIALGGDADGSEEEGSCGLSASKTIQIVGGDVTAVGGAGSLSSGTAAGAGISVSSGQLVAVGGHASGTDGVSAGTCSYGTTTFSVDANVVAAGDGYGIGTYSVSYDEDDNPIMTPADFQLGTSASDTVTVTAMGGDGAANGKGTTTVLDKFVRGDGGTRTTAGTAVRFRLGDPVITVTHNGTVSGYGDFADGWNAAVGLDTSTNPAAVKIFADWTAATDITCGTSFGTGAGFYDVTTNQAGAIYVPDAKQITLDLNNHALNRNLTSPPDSTHGGWVIANLGTLTIRDSGTGGTITGGYTGLGVTGSKSGGGIYNAGTLTLSGGTITKNADGEKGGGVYNAGTFTMNGGKISANIAATGEGGDTCGGGVYNAENATFTMTGGEISGNYSCDTPNEDGGGVYNAGTFTVGGTAKITGNVAKAVYDYRTNSASGGVTDNVYLPSDKTITCSTETPLTSGASIGVTTQTAPTQAAPVDITGGDSAVYSGYFTSDKPSCRIQKSDSGQTVQLASAMTGIFGAKFYQPQVWDCQRSPAFPVKDHSFRLSGLKAPYDQNLKKVNFAAPASDYVTFEYVKAVSELDTATKTRIVSSLKRYTGATAEQIEAAAVVKETLHSAGGTTTLSSIGLVWALGSDGFLYTAMDGAFKYSGGVGTYVTFAAHKTGDSIIYTPDETEPYTKDEIIDDNNKLAPEDGTPIAPAAVTYQELIKVVDGSGTAVSGAMVTITKDDNTYSGTTDTNGYVQFTGLPEKYVDKATVTKGSNTSEYDWVDSPEAVLTFTGNSSDARQDKVLVDFEYGTDGRNLKGGTVSYLGAGAVSDDREYELTKGDTAMFAIKAASGYYVSAATWGSTDILATAKTGVYNAGAVTADTTLTVTFAEIPKESIFDIHYTTAEVFDVQRSPAFPDESAASSIRFSWLAQPYDTNLDYITLGTGEYIKFDKVSSVETAGKTAAYTESLQYWTDATKIGTAALVKENVYKNVNGTPTLQRTLGTGLIWCYNDPAKGFLFTTMDGVLGDCGGVGSYVSFNALRYGSSVTQLTDSAEPLQWSDDWSESSINNDDPQGQPENPDGDTVDDTQDVTFDFLGKVLDATTKNPVITNTDVTLTWAGTDYDATTDTNGRFVVSGLPYAENGDYTAVIGDDSTTFTGELPALGGVENSRTRTASLTAPEIVFLLPSSGTTGTIAATHTITVTKTGSGSVSPAGTVQVSEGGSARIGFAPSSGYTLSEVKIDDGSANADAKTNGYYKFTDVTGDHTVAVTFTANSTPGPVNPPANVPDRIGGDDRYDTASKITEQAFPDGAIEAIVATGEDFPDALCAAGLAGLNSCPIVITNSDALNETSENLLKTLGTTNALVLGGTGAVSENVEEKLSTEVTTGGVNRIGGINRIMTALKIAKSAAFDKEGTAIVVNGSRAADALSIAPYAYSDKDPMFLTSADGTLDPESFAEASKYARILIVGGTGVVTVATEDALKAAVGAGNVTRLGGANRYETSAIVASTLFNSYVGTAFASGRDGSYTDALTGAVLCGQKDVPLILVSETASESSGILSDMKSAGVTAGDLFILGGTAAVSDDTVAAIVKALG
jgi:putative cell wall-binding protein